LNSDCLNLAILVTIAGQQFFVLFWDRLALRLAFASLNKWATTFMNIAKHKIILGATTSPALCQSWFCLHQFGGHH
jgi:hypothetical protein